jgi:hypothetical protein
MVTLRQPDDKAQSVLPSCSLAPGPRAGGAVTPSWAALSQDPGIPVLAGPALPQGD